MMMIFAAEAEEVFAAGAAVAPAAAAAVDSADPAAPGRARLECTIHCYVLIRIMSCSYTHIHMPAQSVRSLFRNLSGQNVLKF